MSAEELTAEKRAELLCDELRYCLSRWEPGFDEDPEPHVLKALRAAHAAGLRRAAEVCREFGERFRASYGVPHACTACAAALEAEAAALERGEE